MNNNIKFVKGIMQLYEQYIKNTQHMVDISNYNEIVNGISNIECSQDDFIRNISYIFNNEMLQFIDAVLKQRSFIRRLFNGTQIVDFVVVDSSFYEYYIKLAYENLVCRVRFEINNKTPEKLINNTIMLTINNINYKVNCRDEPCVDVLIIQLCNKLHIHSEQNEFIRSVTDHFKFSNPLMIIAHSDKLKLYDDCFFIINKMAENKWNYEVFIMENYRESIKDFSTLCNVIFTFFPRYTKHMSELVKKTVDDRIIYDSLPYFWPETRKILYKKQLGLLDRIRLFRYTKIE